MTNNRDGDKNTPSSQKKTTPDAEQPKPLPMKKIGIGVAVLFTAWVILGLIMPAFFDKSPIGTLFNQGPAPWSLTEEENAKLQLTEVQQQGRYHFGNYCASCHGPEGKGNGIMANGLPKRPPNFMSPAAKYVNGMTKEGVHKTLLEGIPNTAMPAYSYMKEDVREAIVEYVMFLKENPGLFP